MILYLSPLFNWWQTCSLKRNAGIVSRYLARHDQDVKRFQSSTHRLVHVVSVDRSLTHTDTMVRRASQV